MSDLELQVVIAVASALFGVIVAVVLAMAMRRTKDPSWAIRSNNLLKDHVSNLEGLHISYGNEPVESVTISRIVFWNRGKDPIRSNDIAEPISIVVSDDVDLLDVQVLQRNNAASQISVSPIEDKRRSNLQFSFLDHDNGPVIQVIHSGESSKAVNIRGQIIGAKHKIHQRNITSKNPFETLALRLLGDLLSPAGAMGFYWGFVLVEILFGAFLVVASAVPAIGVNDRSAVGAAGGMILIGLLWSGSASWSGRLPTGLEVYQEDLLGESSV